MIAKVNKLSIILKKDDLDCNVIDVLVLSLPGLHRLFLQDLHCFLGIVADEWRGNQLQHFLVADELPKSVGGDYHEFIVYVREKVPFDTSQ